MKFKEGTPPKISSKQYILAMSNHPDAVGAWNSEEESFIIADMQCSMRGEEPYDCWYETSFINEKDITGYIELDKI